MKGLKFLIIPCTISFALGGAVCLAIQKLFVNLPSNFDLKLELNIFELITLAITVWLGFHIKLVLDRNSEKANNMATLVSEKIKKMK